MINAILFDLDGTLVNTEVLKALSYARAIMELHPSSIEEADVLQEYKRVVGQSRLEVSEALVHRFGLEKAPRPPGEPAMESPARVLARAFARLYAQMLEDPANLERHICRPVAGLLAYARTIHLKTGLATMSQRLEALRVLKILRLDGEFDSIVTADAVWNPKPDPEVYFLLSGKLGVLPEECLVVEDTPSGIAAALGAGMVCIALASEITRDAVHSAGLLDERFILDDPHQIMKTVKNLITLRAAK